MLIKKVVSFAADSAFALVSAASFMPGAASLPSPGATRAGSQLSRRAASEPSWALTLSA